MHEPELLLETPRFRVLRHWYRTSDGASYSRETVVHPGAVTIVPLLEADRVCLIRNFRPSVGRTLVELPAGTLEPAEDPAAAASRELREETGYRAGTIELLTSFYMSPGILSERMFVFLATDLAGGPARLEAGEQIEPLIVAWPEAVAMALDGRIEDAKTLAALLWVEKKRRST
jgi:ADP-ribose pyrophosphatase